MPVRRTLASRVPIKVWTDDVEASAAAQLVRTGALPFVFKHVAAMADTHWGMGATVGSVIATKGAICPAAVGVDIGCGMAAVRTSLDASALEGKLPRLRASIERGIPVGFHQRSDVHPRAAELLAGRRERESSRRGFGCGEEESRPPVRDARRRKPLHRDLCGRGRRSRLGSSPLGLAQHRQGHGRAAHRPGERRHETPRGRPAGPGSRLVRDRNARNSTITSGTSAGARSSRAPTAKSWSRRS